jgi:rare lipoprotein A
MKKRPQSRPHHQLLPAAAALTVAGILVGGAGAAMKLSPPGGGNTDDLAATHDPADYLPPDREAVVGRASRSESRASAPERGSTGTAAKPPPPPAGGAAVVDTGSCRASYYDLRQRTANGETLNPDGLTAAHKSLPFDSRVRITNLANGQSVIVRVNDRGPYVSERCLNLSRAAFDTIADLDSGVISVRYEVLAEDAT